MGSTISMKLLISYYRLGTAIRPLPTVLRFKNKDFYSLNFLFPLGGGAGRGGGPGAREPARLDLE